jgi:hypothetical protein
MSLRMLRAAPATRSVRDQDDHHVPRSPGRGGAAFLGVFWVMALIANSSAVAFRGILANVFPNLGKGILGYSAFEWGILYAMIPLSRTVMFYFWQTRRGWEYKARYLIGFQLLLLAGAVVLVFNSSYAVFLITFAVIGVGMSKTYFSSLYYAMDSDHSHESRGGTHEAALGAGSALGAPLAGLLARISGSARAPYVFAFSFLTAAMLVQAGLYVTRRGRARRAASE